MKNKASVQINKLFSEDQNSRRNMRFDKKSLQALRLADKGRMKDLRRILKRGGKFTPKDLYMIAMLFQHGSGIADYKKAIFFARRSMESGFKKAKWLYAAAQDRLLMKQGRNQKYGTQYRKTGDRWHLYPVKSSVTDLERKKYNVPPLREALAELKKLNKRP